MNPSQMFKFTQLRPVIGIEIIKVRKKHIPLYTEKMESDLLNSLQKVGFPAGLLKLNSHITSSKFNERLSSFNNIYSNKESKELPELTKMALVIEKVINFSRAENKLSDDVLKVILKKAKDLKNAYSISFERAKEELSKLQEGDKVVIADDCYALLMQSAYYPEFRRYTEALHRFIFLSGLNGTKEVYDVLFSNGDSLKSEQLDLLRHLLFSRILLPENVKKTEKPLPRFEDDKDETTEDSKYVEVVEEEVVEKHLEVKTDYIKGAGFSMQKLRQESLEKPKERLFKLKKEQSIKSRKK